MDDKTELHRSAEMLMRWVRDPSIDSCDAPSSRRMFGPTGERWRDQLAEPQAREAMSQLIPGDPPALVAVAMTDSGGAPACGRSSLIRAGERSSTQVQATGVVGGSAGTCAEAESGE